MLDVPSPQSSYPSDGGYSTPVQSNCPELSTQCPFGYLYDNASGCATNECAPDPAIQQQEFDAQCIKDQQRSLKDFSQYQIKDGERRLKELVRNKVTAPVELQGLINQMKAGYTSALGLTECQGLNTATQDLYQLSNEFNDRIRDVEDVMNAARCLKDAQRELKEFEGYSIKEVERKILRAKKQKVAIPEAITAGLAQVKALFAEAKKATECQDMQDAKSEMHSVNNDLQEHTMQLDFLIQMPQMIKQITREMKNIERQWKTASNKAKKSKADLSDLVARGQGLLDAMQGIFNELKSALASGNFELMRDVMERGDSEAREYEEEIFEIIRTIDALSNAPRYLKDLDRRVKDTRRQAKDMARFEKMDTSGLTACLDNVQPLIDAAKAEVNRRPADPDATADAISAIEEGLSDCDEVRSSLEGKRQEFFGEFIPDQIFNAPALPAPPPPAFR